MVIMTILIIIMVVMGEIIVVIIIIIMVIIVVIEEMVVVDVVTLIIVGVTEVLNVVADVGKVAILQEMETMKNFVSQLSIVLRILFLSV